MIPLDHNFAELLNETVPFPLPKASETTVPKVVPTPVAAAKPPVAPAEPTASAPAVASAPPKLKELDNSASDASKPLESSTFDYTSSTFDCHYETSYFELGHIEVEPQLVSFPQPELGCTPAAEVSPEAATESAPEAEPVSEKSSVDEVPHSKVEITTERSVPFEIDTRMMINRPRLTLKESGLPVALSPAEPDPSIVGESVLGFKLESPLKDQEVRDEICGKIHGEVSNEMLDLLEQRAEMSDKPVLKAFNPEEMTSESPKQESTSSVEHEHDKTLNAFLYDNACELDDESEEYGLVGEPDSIKDALLAEQAKLDAEAQLTEEDRLREQVRLAEEVAEIEAYELDDDVTEEDLYAYETMAAAATTEEATATEKTDEAAFFPMLQVDRFAWPNFCLDMHPIIKTQLGHLGEQLITKSVSGRKVIAVVGSGPGAGSSSILLGLATSLEAAGHRVAMIDANINSPTLATSLGLQPEHGWETVVSGKLPIEESLIDSIEDRIALLPLCLDSSQKITFGVRPSENDRMNNAILQMKDNYDLVLVDLGSPEPADIAAFANMSEWIDSAVVVHNLRDGTRAQLIRAKNLMRDYGVSVAGIAENFAPRESCFDDESEYRAA